MSTPEEKQLGKQGGPAESRAASQAGAIQRQLWSFLRSTAELFGRAVMFVLRAVGKFCLTTWRLASALDSALWRAVKLIFYRFLESVLHGLKLTGHVLQSLMMWLPTRTGRAYSAICGVVLIVSVLWIVDFVREGLRIGESAGENLRPPIDEEDPILARIEGRYVHLSEITAAARASGDLEPDAVLTPTTAFRRGLVETYVEQRLLARAAQDSGVHRAPAVLRRVNAARDRILAASLVQSRLDREVTEESVERFYLAQRQITQIGDEVRARHILVDTEEAANEIIALLEGGADFRSLARERSQDRATAPLGGEIGWFSRAMMERPLSSVAFATTVGDVAAPFKTDFGWHVLEVQGRRPTSAKPFEEVKDDIEEYLRLRLINETLADLETQNQVVYFRPEPTDEGITAAAPLFPSSTDIDTEEEQLEDDQRPGN
ncbi:MAG: peptidylprolyl isomerase [Pseudomonadota bacterium]